MCLDGSRVSHPTRPVTMPSHTQSVKEMLTDGNLSVQIPFGGQKRRKLAEEAPKCPFETVFGI